MPLKRGTHWVLTHNLAQKSENSTVKFTNLDPEQLLEKLTKDGHKEICIIGGSEIASQFMQKNLIDEIFLDVEPLLFGQGMPLFKPADFEAKLELLDVNHLSPQTIQLHYRVKK